MSKASVAIKKIKKLREVRPVLKLSGNPKLAGAEKILFKLKQGLVK